MRPPALSLLCCPTCQGDLALDAPDHAADGHVMTGRLGCAPCQKTYPITGGVPRLVAGSVSPASTETAGRFGAQWKTFDHMSTYQEQWLRKWLDPIGPDDFTGKVILEAGCGKGRHTLVASDWGAAEIVALDLSESVDVAFFHARERKNVHVVQGDILCPPVRRVFDLAFSVGVLHHLPDPRAGFDKLRGRVKPGGKIAVWVYGHENNEWIVRYVNPFRNRITARMNPELLYWLSLPPSAALAMTLVLYRNERVAKLLPYRDYLRQLATVPLREVHNIVFDQLVTPIAFYMRQDEVRSWFSGQGLGCVTLSWHNKNSWRASALVTE
ncbi:MAG: methyltransferase domain-containing protein [Deltaproteobacteria bacterium]|nr:methyltransferase domain-containing protein [Deltaproteobacteria bacterium]